jgi:hypothetical protein
MLVVRYQYGTFFFFFSHISALQTPRIKVIEKQEMLEQ